MPEREIHQQSMLLGEIVSDIKTLYKKMDEVVANQRDFKSTEEDFKNAVIKRIDELERNTIAKNWLARGLVAGVAAGGGAIGAKVASILGLLR